jgi:hypothetical protein
MTTSGYYTLIMLYKITMLLSIAVIFLLINGVWCYDNTLSIAYII